MLIVETEVDRCLRLLRLKMREQGFSQTKVQKMLGWGESYISQLMTKQKCLRYAHVLAILNVIGVEPGAFFGELFGTGAAGQTPTEVPAAAGDLEPIRGALGQSSLLLDHMFDLLLKKNLISVAEHAEVRNLAQEPERAQAETPTPRSKKRRREK